MTRRVLLLFALWGSRVAAQFAPPAIIPAPASMALRAGSCPLTCLVVHPEGDGAASVAALFAQELGPLLPEVECDKTRPISLALIRPDTIVPEEAYWLDVSPDRIGLTAATEAGLYRGTRTLLQLFGQYSEEGQLPCLSITDQPRFPWRGMHLDVCRHFFPVPFIKQYIDLLARYKMNSFHWHLTDDQGWRIEIKKYPKLTSVGAWRNGSQVGPYGRREYDTLRYGGFYTQEQIREVVAYAAARHINVVPEIEMPGHALAALAAYPELSCTGGPFEVAKGWGVFDDVFCTKDSVITFLDDVLDEVMDLFPSPYIHIGGDECPHVRWEACPRCQAVMAREGLKTTDELQSYFIRRIEQHVNARGRKIIGWDEILQGGLAPNATVMSWRGTEGGIAAAKSGHDAVMSPGEYCYFDHYQGDPANEPLAIGGYTTVQKVYGYEPVPDGLPPEQAHHILGAQGNVWTEYIPTPEQVEYMAVPRMLALAEVLWTPKAKRDEKDFIQRLEEEFPHLDSLKVKASKSVYQVSIHPQQSPKAGEIAVEMSSGSDGAISMTEMPPPYDEANARLAVYTGPVILNSDREICGWLQRRGGLIGPVSRERFLFNKATARKITTSPTPDERYDDGGAFTLVDGVHAGERRINTEWLGWRSDVTLTMDLGSVQPLDSIRLGSWHETYAWIHAPKQVTISTSTDGKNFMLLGDATAPIAPNGYAPFLLTKHAEARYVRLQVKSIGRIPEGFAGAGSPAWLFLDELEVK